MNGRLAKKLRKAAQIVAAQDSRAAAGLEDRAARRLYRGMKRDAHRDQGQHPILQAERRRRAPARHGPSRPATKDQRKQSRPMIVISPVKHLDPKRGDVNRVRRLCERLPKCVIDGAVLAGWRSP